MVAPDVAGGLQAADANGGRKPADYRSRVASAAPMVATANREKTSSLDVMNGEPRKWPNPEPGT
jgi:hypothetical protein